jgi:primosomal protein N' (replication factor Y)
MAFAEVVVTLPVEGRFHYRIPDHLVGHLEVGHRVLVAFGPRRVTGFVLALDDATPADLDPAKVKTIEARLDPEPLLPSDLLALARFAADYYLAPPGEVLKVALPPGFTGASKLRWVLTAEGRRALEAGRPLPSGDPPSEAEAALLVAAQKSGVARGKVKKKTAARLEAAGWLALRDALAARDGGGEVEMVRRRLGPVLAEPFLMGSKLRRAVYDALSGGPRPLPDLKAELGASRIRAALARLVEGGVLEIATEATQTSPFTSRAAASAEPDAPRFAPTEAQRAALEALGAALAARASKAFLLQGVTGSGKTEVYLGLIEQALGAGRGALVLVPEIALTPQLEARFRERFGPAVAVLHSGVPDAARRARWRDLREGRAWIALGPRSAVWAPVRDLGVVVVDEEHDASFKQHTELRYSGRDLALVRARQVGAVAVLGSATPSLEALRLVEQGRLERLRLDARVEGRPMPDIEIVDLAEERRALKGDIRLLSRALEDGLREGRARGEQAIVFLNRRGFNTIVHCGACDDVKKCPRCDVSLTHHRAERKTACHYCGYEEPLAAPCRSCGSGDVRPLGAGTERVAAAITEALPDLRVARLDRDVTQKAGGLDHVLDAFRAGEADVLVGTQMVAKGHDFPRVTLVGVILADASLAFPDFRSAERTFQLLTQVAGRAGRADRPGRVIVQTLQPEHYALTSALRHDVDGFWALERGLRAELGYPPFSRLGAARVEGLDAERAEAAAARLAEHARATAAEDLRVLGPAPAPIGKVRDRYRHLLLLFAPTPARLVSWMRKVRSRAVNELRGVDLVFDVDAVDLL